MPQAINSRLYTNVILTVIAVMLTVVGFREVFSISTPAAAQTRNSLTDDGGEEETAGGASSRFNTVGDVKLAEATRKIAESNKDIAAAIRESAKAQTDIAEALRDLGAAMLEPAQ